MDRRPFVVTAELEDRAQVRLNFLREKYFPPERNHLDAHLTLFHDLSPDCQGLLIGVLEQGAKALPFAATCTHLMRFGRGFAAAIDCSTLAAWHRTWQKTLKDHVSPQDSQKLRAHITLQNKVSGEQAAKDFAEAKDLLSPFATQIVSLSLWRYDNGPWAFVRRFG